MAGDRKPDSKPTMWLTNAQRLRLLARHLVRQPAYIPAYLRHLPVWRRSPLEIGLPWWSYAAISRCREIVNRDSAVFEFGSGGSTVFLARRAKSVVCVEDSPGWIAAVESKLKQIGAAHCTLQRVDLPLPVDDEQKWEAYLRPMQGQYDLIVVDGQDLPNLRFRAPGVIRTRCFLHSEHFVRPGGAIIVDDSWRYEHLRTASRAKRVETLTSVGPCRIGVTSTDIYYY